MRTGNSATLAWLTWLGLVAYNGQKQKAAENSLKEEMRRMIKEKVGK